MFTNPFRRALVAVAAAASLSSLALGQIAAEPADDPVLVRLGAVEERASLVLERFDIAVRGLAGSQGVPYGPELMAQVYPFLPQFLDQRASELVLLEQARARGLAVEESVVEGVVDQARGQFPDEAAFTEVLVGAGFAATSTICARSCARPNSSRWSSPPSSPRSRSPRTRCASRTPGSAANWCAPPRSAPATS